MFFILIVLGFRWAALLITGMALQYHIFHTAPISDLLMLLGMALFMWLLSKLFSSAMKAPVTALKFLNTRRKRIIAAVATFALGFLMGFNIP